MHPVARLVAWSAAHARLVIVLAAALTVAAGVYAARHFAMSADTLSLIDPSVDWRQDEFRLYRAFPRTGETILVVVDGATPEAAGAAADALAGRLTGAPAVESLVRPDNGPFFDRHGLLFLSEAEVRRATEAMVASQPLFGPIAADPSLRGVAGAFATLAEGAAAEGRLGELAPTMARLAAWLEAGGREPFSWQGLGGAPPSPTRRLLLVQPRLDYAALRPGAEAAAAIRSAAAGLPDVRVRLTGPAPLADEELGSLADDAPVVGLVMATAMLLTLWLAVRSARMVAAIMAVTLAGLVIAGALGLAAVGRFNVVSVAFVPLFVGLGVDFAIQLAARFREEVGRGDGAAPALARAGAAMGPSLLVAGGAVTLGFLAFLPTAYVGVAELGVIAAMGMVVALALSLTLLPALLVLTRAEVRGQPGWAGAAPLDVWLARHRRAVLGAFGVALLASVAALPFVRFDFDPMNLRDPEREAMATLADLTRDPDRTPNLVQIVAPSLGEARELAARLEGLPEVRRVVTVDDFVPRDQAEKLALIADARAILELTLDPFDVAPPPTDGATVAALGEAARRLQAAGGSSRPLGDAFEGLARGAAADRARVERGLTVPLARTLASLRAALSAEPVTLASLPSDLRRDWLHPDGRARVAVFPADASTNAALARFTSAVRRVAPTATGAPVTIQEAARTIAAAFVQAGAIALALVAAVLFAVLRSAKEVALTLAPVALSIFLTLGTCVVIGQPINFANIIAFPLLFGVGVAFHIYFVMAWRGGATNLLQSSLARAVFFSALATGTAFGAVWLSGHPGTASMGKVLMLSLFWTLVCALVFEPALLGPPSARAPTAAPVRRA